MKWLLLASVAITGVNITNVDGNALLNQTVLVEGERITAVGRDLVIPSEARVIRGNGGWLVPGLIDMHVHVRAADMRAYLEHGITTVRDMAGLDSVLSVRATVPAPEIIVATRLLNGPNPAAPFFSRVVTSAAGAEAAVSAELSRGCDFVKLYHNLQRPVYDALIAAARARRVKVGGHVSEHVDVTYAMQMQDSIEHLSGYDRALAPDRASFRPWVDVDSSRISDLVNRTRASGVWNCPTLRIITRDRSAVAQANMRAFVGALHQAGANLLAGTDGGYLLPAGSALFDEFDELLAAGLPPRAVLASATTHAATYLGRSEELGRIAPGYLANFSLVATDPLLDLRTITRARGVMVRGEWMDLSSPRRRAVRSASEFAHDVP